MAVVAAHPEDRHGEAHRQRRRAQAAYQQGGEEARVQAEDPRAGAAISNMSTLLSLERISRAVT